MDELREIARLKKEVRDQQREADKAQGSLDRLFEELKKEFECGTLKKAEAKLINLRREEARAKKAFLAALEKFTEEWDAE